MFVRLRSVAVAAASCSLALVLAACAQSTPGAAAPGPPEPDPGLARFYEQQLSWGPCGEYAVSATDQQTYANPALECARLEVPLDYAAPDGETAQIGVLRQKATGERVGSLLMNPGGPGGSGMSLAASLSGRLTESPLAQRFDLVGFDPRGVGASTPTIDCLNDAEWEAERADLDVDPSPAGVDQTEAENQQYAQRCAERSGGPEVLANVGTRDVVRDMDILRQALGDEKLTYLGYSYGTRIGSAYAEAFPQNVRALVLDGALDPTQTTVQRTVDQNAGFQQAFEAYAADCATQPNCPLGTDPAQATANFQALTRPLIDQPAAAEGGARTLSYPDAVTGTIQALYLSEYWPVLSRGLSSLAAGDGTILLRLADVYNDRGQDGHYGNSIEAFIVISCVDEERITDRAEQGELIRRSTEAAPFRDDGRGVVAALDPCAFWPSPPTSEPHVPQVEGVPPTLTISVTGDPATPYQAGVDLAEALNGGLLSVDGSQHTAALQGNQCVDDIVSSYLIDLQLPAEGARCTL
ncbi:alpha/beta hydrolase [Pseudonocardia sp. MH-G8]|uniref:alpha/beta hydrolase n=1 Tax=Pseudonocardia sp. MH-G8 TaxID=1854588 RepID=UPI000BA06571|nr:alpha/beta hydrolase [Pseudonocardia sp. MH-G8]OZM77377.1 alpha/beta hydrolase [Pseudonocardia sp. MH-G8]